MTSFNLIAATAGAPWYLDTKFWVALPVVLFLAFVIYKGALRALMSTLDNRADEIRNNLDEARRLREEAQALLASYHRKQKDAEVQAGEIVEQARKDAESMATQARKDLKDRLERRAAQAEARIETAEAQAIADVKAKAADMALAAAEQIMKNDLSPAQKAALVKTGISEMSKTLN